MVLRARPGAAGCAAADGERGLHALAPMVVDRAVDLVAARCRQVDRERRRGPRLDLADLLLDAMALDLEGVRDLAVVRDLEGVRAGLRDVDRARSDRVLLL